MFGGTGNDVVFGDQINDGYVNLINVAGNMADESLLTEYYAALDHARHENDLSFRTHEHITGDTRHVYFGTQGPGWRANMHNGL